MNNDRFLTRVFDKQEKKMLYQGDELHTKYTKYTKYITYIFQGVDKFGIIATHHGNIATYYGNIESIPFGNRFVPMMCSGSKTDDIKKLLYESDIIKYKNSLAIIKWDLYEGLYLEPLIYDDNYKFHSTSFEVCKFIGNKWENPEILEQTNEQR